MPINDKDLADLESAAQRAASAEDGRCNSGLPQTTPNRSLWKLVSKVAAVLFVAAGIYYFSRPATPSVLITDLEITHRMINEIFPRDYVLLTRTFKFETSGTGRSTVYSRELKGFVGQPDGKEADPALIQDCIQKWLAKQVATKNAASQADGNRINLVIPYDAPQTRGEWRYTLTLKDIEKRSTWEIDIHWHETPK
jgi:hypothetical protein